MTDDDSRPGRGLLLRLESTNDHAVARDYVPPNETAPAPAQADVTNVLGRASTVPPGLVLTTLSSFQGAAPARSEAAARDGRRRPVDRGRILPTEIHGSIPSIPGRVRAPRRNCPRWHGDRLSGSTEQAKSPGGAQAGPLWFARWQRRTTSLSARGRGDGRAGAPAHHSDLRDRPGR